ncbi:FmdE family protein [uncultured Methanolobus sp.]|uniref:FmdE family protein n=1 Tax=uncultured Methanolobus sp. TaxID=218300 RepID=UPI002AAC08AA|nr:FmdE family protein [uncultured Methanolobus sp.]
MFSETYKKAGTEFGSGVLGDQDIEKLKINPRENFIKAIQKMDAATCLIKTAEIHGHFCPGSALGVMASLYGLSLLGDEGINSNGIMENLLGIVEINACFADGVQAVSGCTLGNNSLIYRDLGKLAVTFAIRGKEDAVRVKVLPEFKKYIDEAVPEFFPLMEKVIMRREGNPSDEMRFKEKGREAAFSITKIPFEDLFSAEKITPDIPDYAPISDSVLCNRCGEPVMASKVWKSGPQEGMCFMCSGEYSEVEGRGIVEKSSLISKGNHD